MVYECPCGKITRETMPPRICTPKCEIERPQLTVSLIRPCEDCRNADPNIYDKLHRGPRERPTTQIYDKPLPGIPEPGATEGLPPSYHHATEQPLTYAQAIAEEEPASYENVMMVVATFQPEAIVRAWHTFRASQLSLLHPLLADLQSLERRVCKAKRHLHRAEDIGFCEEVLIRLAREQRYVDAGLQWGQRYLDASQVLKYGLDKYQNAARECSKAGDYEQARLHVKAASEHADRLLKMKIQLSRPGQQPRALASSARQQLYLLEQVVQNLEGRTTSRVWALLQVALRADYDAHC